MKIYHICTIEDAASILRKGFRPPKNEKLIESMGITVTCAQRLADVVSFTVHTTEPWRAMVMAGKAIYNSTADKIQVTALEFEIPEEQFVGAVISNAILFREHVGNVQMFDIGCGVEITVERAVINKCISGRKVKRVPLSRVPKNNRMVQLARSNTLELLKTDKKLAKQSKEFIANAKKHTKTLTKRR